MKRFTRYMNRTKSFSTHKDEAAQWTHVYVPYALIRRRCAKTMGQNLHTACCTSDHFYKPQVKEVKEMVLSDLKAAASVQTFHRFICQICIYLDICVYLVLNAFFHRYLSVKTLA